MLWAIYCGSSRSGQQGGALWYLCINKAEKKKWSRSSRSSAPNLKMSAPKSIPKDAQVMTAKRCFNDSFTFKMHF